MDWNAPRLDLGISIQELRDIPNWLKRTKTQHAINTPVKEFGDIHILNEQLCCPSCMSSNIQIRWSIKTILQKLFPFNGLYDYMCLDCQYNFKSKEEL